MTEMESEIQYRCPPGMRVLRVADVVQIQGGPAVVVKVSECNAVVLPMWGTKKVVVNKFDGKETVINAQRGPVAVSNNMEPSQILQHMTDAEYQEFLAARTPAKRSKSKPTNNQAGEKQEQVMAKNAKQVKVVKESKAPRIGGLGELCGFSVASVVRRLGKEGVTGSHAMAILKANKIKASKPGVATMLFNGRHGIGGDVAPLTAEQVAELVTSAPIPARANAKKEVKE